MNYIFSSMGNDSMALIQWMHDDGQDAVVVYNNTGWASDVWPQRVAQGRALVESFGFGWMETEAMGFWELAQKKKAFPRNGMQFCTEHLKRLPSLALLDQLDPDGDDVCVVGIRREESRSRSTFPEYTEESSAHGNRSLWAPLVRYTTADRDKLLAKTGMPILPHRSQECFPCINANRADLQRLTEARIVLIEGMERKMGVGVRSGKQKWFFRPYRHQGAEGIRAVKAWADKKPAKGADPQLSFDCDSGFCV